MEISRNISLADLTTFRIGGKAKYFIAAQNKEDFLEAIKFSEKKKLPFFILGGGSNLLVSDKGFSGLVIKMENARCEVGSKKVFVETGVMLADLVKASIKRNLSGLEWAAGIPGTAGGAIRGNAGAYGGAMSDCVIGAQVISKNSKVLNFNLSQCRFRYRESVFKSRSDLVVWSASLRLRQGDYRQSKKLCHNYLVQRKKKCPLAYPSAGCVFKNPKPFVAAKLIEECGLKGKRVGQAKISEKHANFIINLGGAKAKDVVSLIDLIKDQVGKKFNVGLEEEIQYLGF